MEGIFELRSEGAEELLIDGLFELLSDGLFELLTEGSLELPTDGIMVLPTEGTALSTKFEFSSITVGDDDGRGVGGGLLLLLSVVLEGEFIGDNDEGRIQSSSSSSKIIIGFASLDRFFTTSVFRLLLSFCWRDPLSLFFGYNCPRPR
jgi:hypothetical protein